MVKKKKQDLKDVVKEATPERPQPATQDVVKEVEEQPNKQKKMKKEKEVGTTAKIFELLKQKDATFEELVQYVGKSKPCTRTLICNQMARGVVSSVKEKGAKLKKYHLHLHTLEE